MVRPVAAVAVSAAAVAAVAALSVLPYEAEPPGRALLRLSWRARGETIERCRPATAEELAGVPAHMRQETVCEDPHVAPYRLRLTLDDSVIIDERVGGSGVPGDRPMYVFRELPVRPGLHRIDVRFQRDVAPDDSAAASTDREDEDDDDSRRARAPRRRAVPPVLRLDSAVVVEDRAVVLVTYDGEHGRLTMAGARPAAPPPRGQADFR